MSIYGGQKSTGRYGAPGKKVVPKFKGDLRPPSGILKSSPVNKAAAAAALKAHNESKGTSSSSPAPVAQKAADSTAAAGMTQADLVKGYALERAKILAGIGPQIQDIYQQAGANIGSDVGGATSALQQHLYDVGGGKASAFGQEDPRIAASYNIDAAPNAAAYLGKTLPQDTLNTQGASYGAAAAFGPAAALQEGQYDLVKAIQANKVTNAEASKVSASVSKLMGFVADSYGNPVKGANGKPIPLPEAKLTPYQQAQINLSTGRLNLASESLKVRAGQIDYQKYKDDRSYQLQVDKANATNARYYAGLDLRTANSKIALKKANIDAGRIDSAASKIAGHIVLRDGSTPKQKNGQPFALAASNKPKTTSDQAKIDKVIGEWYNGKDVKQGTVKTTNANGDPVTKYVTKPVGQIGYQPALRKLMNQYGLTLDDATTRLNTLWKRGERGRPYVSLQEARWMLKQPKLVKAGITASVLKKARSGFSVDAKNAASIIDHILTANGINL